MDYFSTAKISPASDCSKHAPATVWLPCEGFHDPKISYKELKTTQNKLTNTKSHYIGKEKNLHHILQRKKLQRRGKLFINFNYFSSESLYLKEGKFVGCYRFSTFS